MNAPHILLEQCRFNMIEQQIRPAGVLDEHVLSALMHLEREAFVGSKYKPIAYSDVEIPIEVDSLVTCENMLFPRIEAFFAEALKLKITDSVLEIGTGSGFQAALLSRLCTMVKSVELNAGIADFARKNLSHNHIANVTVEVGDAQAGWGNAEYDAILVTGSLPTLPDSLKYQLAEGGRLVATIGRGPAMKVLRVTRLSASTFETEELMETNIKPLRGPVVSNFTF